MIQEQLNKYIWIVDTLRRYKRLTRAELDERWKRSPFSERGEGLPRRTFYNYRQAIEEIFGLEIKYDPATFEFYIEGDGEDAGQSIVDWLLNSASTNNLLSDSRQIANRIFLEDVPSAREHLGKVIDAVKGNQQLQFDYAPYTRVNPSTDVVIEPYFLNLSKNRWYVTGRNVSDNKIKTYALDRMLNVGMLSTNFAMPEDFDPAQYSRNAFGVIFSQGKVYDVVLQADSRRAKYLRTLPLHHSQREELHDSYSLFHYRLLLTPDLLAELLSMGSSVSVVSPPELKAMMVDELKKSLDNY